MRNRSEPVKDVAGVVLAGGEGRRFEGEHKPVAEFRGKPLVAHAVEALADALTTAPTVVVGDDSQRIIIERSLGADARFVYDDGLFEGPLAGLVGAIDSTYLDWLFVCGCDMPFVTHESVLRLAEERELEPKDDAVVPVEDGHPQTAHALYRRASVDRVTDALGPGDSLRDVLGVLPRVRRLDGDDFGRATTSVDTREELEGLEDRGREKPGEGAPGELRS